MVNHGIQRGVMSQCCIAIERISPSVCFVGELSKFMNRFIASEAWSILEKQPTNIVLLDFVGRHSPELLQKIIVSNFTSNVSDDK